MKLAHQELSKLFGDWEHRDWAEIEWDKLKEMQVRDILDNRNRQALAAQMGHCIECPQFVKHVRPKAHWLGSADNV